MYSFQWSTRENLLDDKSFFLVNWSDWDRMIHLYLKIPENFLSPWPNFNLLHDSQGITFPTQTSLVLYFFCDCLMYSLIVGLVWFGLVWFYGISTIVGYLMPNPFYTFILNIHDSKTHFKDNIF